MSGFVQVGREIVASAKHRGLIFFFPYSLRIQGKKKAYDAVQNDTVCFSLSLSLSLFSEMHEMEPF
jgi:hypothetical protein